jgi:hypothetical protein
LGDCRLSLGECTSFREAKRANQPKSDHPAAGPAPDVVAVAVFGSAAEILL